MLRTTNRALIVGLGSIGRRHLINLRALVPSADITLLRRPTSRPDGCQTLANRVVYTIDHALRFSPQFAILSNPAPKHISVGMSLAKNGVHLCIEKPLSHSLDGVDDLITTCQKLNLTLVVAYHLRFCRSLRAVVAAVREGRIGRPMGLRAEVGQYLPEWRENVDYRNAVSARRELGGGVLLELSHELDYANWIIGAPVSVTAHIGRLSNLDVDVEDYAEINLRFANGAIGNIHLDMVQRPSTRSCKVYGTDGTIVWNGLVQRADYFNVENGEWSELCSPDETSGRQAYITMLEHFLACVRGEAAPLIDGLQGKQALEVALAARRAAEEKREVKV